MSVARDAAEVGAGRADLAAELADPISVAGGISGLPWSDAEFSDRILAVPEEGSFQMPSARPYTAPLHIIDAQIPALIEWVGFRPGTAVLDAACGRGGMLSFVFRGSILTGVDVSPAAIRVSEREGVGCPATFLEADIASLDLADDSFELAMYLYGQASLHDRDDLMVVLRNLRRMVRPGGSLAIEVINPDAVPTAPSRTWAAGENVWGLGTHLVLSERTWNEAEQLLEYSQCAVDCTTGERFVYREIERVITADDLVQMLHDTGFDAVEVHPGWDGRLGHEGDHRLLMIGR